MSTSTTRRQIREFSETPSAADLQTLDRVYSANYGGWLTVVGLSYGAVSDEAVLSGEAKPISATLSADGRSWASGHLHRSVDGPTSEEAVYVERLADAEVVFHGWVDSVSRRIVQCG